MLIDKSIKQYMIFSEDTILSALKKIEQNKRQCIFALNYSGVLEGVITDGDLRRWMTKQNDLDLSQTINCVMNINYVSHLIDDDLNSIAVDFSSGINIIPLVDKSNRLKAVAIDEIEGITIGGYVISNDNPAFIIAEIGNNHNGNLGLAKELVDLAVESGADCAKFQMRSMSSLYKNGALVDDHSSDLGTEYTLDLLKRFQLSNRELIEIFDYCKDKKIAPLCTPWDIESLKILEDYGMDAYKVASADLTNTELLEALANTGKPLICSTGMSTEAEIKLAVSTLRKKGTQFIMLHCNSTYPAPYKDINLNYIKRLKDLTGALVGYSGHERGGFIPLAAIAMDAKIIEKHFTIDKSMEGNDHKVSLLPEEFSDMVHQIRALEQALGNSTSRKVSQGESINREVLAKSLVINQDLMAGDIIQRSMIEIMSPGQGLQPYQIDDLVGKVAQRDFKAWDYFFDSDIKEQIVSARKYSYSRPFGIPVRYHDYSKLTKETNVDFVEFHLSYRDLDVNIEDFFKSTQEIDFFVHSPELFANDHIMDLCSTNLEYKNRSIHELNRVTEATRKLKSIFPNTKKPKIIINAGGFSSSKFIKKSSRKAMYKNVADSLKKVNQEGVEIIIQTMPPFPWHFGGQSYHNIFVDPKEISKFCETTGYKICFDVSHSQMACTYFKWDMDPFVDIVGKYIAHLHIVDALDVDGEGIQIGEGDVNFRDLSSKLNELAPGVSFLPEIWQGHKQHGYGFWQALDFLEEYF
jgi:sialic acid synthase SpsE/sugar phosphate isomerase/epimerase